MDIEGAIIVKNVWCGCCGKQEFIMRQSFMLTCVRCESQMRFSFMSCGNPGGWYVNDAPATPHVPDSIDERLASKTGIEWIPYPSSDIHHARIKYNCDTGKLLGDERVIRKLKESKDGLLRKVEKTKYLIRKEEQTGLLGQ